MPASDFDRLMKKLRCEDPVLGTVDDMPGIALLTKDRGARLSAYVAVTDVRRFRRLDNVANKIEAIDDAIMGRVDEMDTGDLLRTRQAFIDDERRIGHALFGTPDEDPDASRAGAREQSPSLSVHVNALGQAVTLPPAAQGLPPPDRERVREVAGAILARLHAPQSAPAAPPAPEANGSNGTSHQ